MNIDNVTSEYIEHMIQETNALQGERHIVDKCGNPGCEKTHEWEIIKFPKSFLIQLLTTIKLFVIEEEKTKEIVKKILTAHGDIERSNETVH